MLPDEAQLGGYEPFGAEQARLKAGDAAQACGAGRENEQLGEKQEKDSGGASRPLGFPPSGLPALSAAHPLHLPLSRPPALPRDAICQYLIFQ